MSLRRYTNDRTAPRMRKSRFTTHVITNELLHRFREAHPEFLEMTNPELKQCWGKITDKLQDAAVTNPLGLKLSFYLGELKVQYVPNKKKIINNGEKEVVVNYLNLHSKGKVGKVKWERRWAVKYNEILQFFAFIGSRQIIRKAATHLRNNPDVIRVARNTLGGKNSWRK